MEKQFGEIHYGLGQGKSEMNENSENDTQIKFEFVPHPEKSSDAKANKKTYLSRIPFPGCMKCKHLIVRKKVKGRFICEAYPDRIPTEIMLGYIDHTKPYKNDQGIQFEPLDDPDEERRRIKALKG